MTVDLKALRRTAKDEAPRDGYVKLSAEAVLELCRLAEERTWRPIATAPTGEPDWDVGHRAPSEWFIGLRRDGAIYKVRRASIHVGHDWEDSEETYYTDVSGPWFTHWMPEPPK